MSYASRCSGRTADLMHAAGWGFLLVPNSCPPRPDPRMPYVLDNGAWFAHTHGTEWDSHGFARLVSQHGAGCDWVAAPDIVAGGAKSLKRSLGWVPLLLSMCPKVLIPVQDGMTAEDLEPLVGDRVGLFVGGSTEWKEHSTVRIWGPLARRTGCHLHVARVNSVRRIALCQDAGADSIDGTSVVRYSKTLPKLDGAIRQEHIFRRES